MHSGDASASASASASPAPAPLSHPHIRLNPTFRALTVDSLDLAAGRVVLGADTRDNLGGALAEKRVYAIDLDDGAHPLTVRLQNKPIQSHVTTSPETSMTSMPYTTHTPADSALSSQPSNNNGCRQTPNNNGACRGSGWSASSTSPMRQSRSCAPELRLVFLPPPIHPSAYHPLGTRQILSPVVSTCSDTGQARANPHGRQDIPRRRSPCGRPGPPDT